MKTVRQFLDEYAGQYKLLYGRTDEYWKSAVEWGEYWLTADTEVRTFLHEATKMRGDYFTSDKEVAAVFYTLAQLLPEVILGREEEEEYD